MKKFLYMLLGCIALPAMVCSGCHKENVEKNAPVQSMDTAMGTIINQTLYGEEAQVCVDEILELIEMLEQRQLSWRCETSEVWAINSQAGSESGIAISQEMQRILEQCRQVSSASGGAFDITLGKVVRLWDIDTWSASSDTLGYLLPRSEILQQTLEATGYEKLVWESDGLHLPKEMQLDLGAVGKGIALDEIGEYLTRKDGITGGVISVGGSILTYGNKPDKSPWRVGVVNPLDANGNLGYLELSGEWCVSTSGDYERYVEVDGVRYHHIIDPATGYPADSGVRGVTILSKDGLLSDALSTACFILGVEEGKALAESFEAEALFVKKDGNIVMTEGMERYFHLSK